jgi:hypothetical protein
MEKPRKRASMLIRSNLLENCFGGKAQIAQQSLALLGMNLFIGFQNGINNVSETD